MAYLARRLDAIPERGGQGSMLDDITIFWKKELGKRKSHTLDNIPFGLGGGGLGFKCGQEVKFDNVADNRLWLSIAHGFGHHFATFGREEFSQGGALALSRRIRRLTPCRTRFL